MEIKTVKIFSYRDDFDGEDNCQETLSEYGICDTYIDYDVIDEENDEISAKLIGLGAVHGDTVLIHLDW